MTIISYTLGSESGNIAWAASESFDELRGKTYQLGKMEAVEIVKLENLSLTAKILLSAVAGALIQHLLDQGHSPDQISQIGKFTIN